MGSRIKVKYKIIRGVVKTLLRYLSRLPLLDKVIENILEDRNFAKQHRHEILLLQGKHKTSNSHQSIVFFTLPKSGSCYVSNLLKKLALEEGVTPIGLEGYFWDGGKSKKDIFCIPFERLQKKGEKAKTIYEHRGVNMGEAFMPLIGSNVLTEELAKMIYKRKGYLYSPFREFNEGIPSLEKYKVILMLRDPRDVLVSSYFSIAYSHSIPERNPNEAKRRLILREKALKMTIDEYVLEGTGTLLNIYSRYCERLLNKSYVLFVKYEEMVNGFESWLDRVINFTELHPRSEVKDEIARGADFKVAEENIYAHKRQVTPGDHQRKLRAETIKALNARFQEVLEKLSCPL